MRLCVAAAAARFRDMPLREGIRRIARKDFAIFTDSMIGKVVLAVAGDARSTLLRVPEVYARVTRSGPVLVHELDEHSLRIEFREFHGLPEYHVGQLEGVLLHYGTEPRISLQHAGHELTLDVQTTG